MLSEFFRNLFGRKKKPATQLSMREVEERLWRERATEQETHYICDKAVPYIFTCTLSLHVNESSTERALAFIFNPDDVLWKIHTSEKKYFYTFAEKTSYEGWPCLRLIGTAAPNEIMEAVLENDLAYRVGAPLFLYPIRITQAL